MLTLSGKRIINLRTVEGETVYPYRGQVVIKEVPKIRIKNLMWDINGRSFYKMSNNLDLCLDDIDK
ncbi:MAG: hypothetical protein M0P12_01280 [Paludibacteraceae bacterium]|nr:hypothetical protein [Paludibacteraceae bacterium]